MTRRRVAALVAALVLGFSAVVATRTVESGSYFMVSVTITVTVSVVVVLPLARRDAFGAVEVATEPLRRPAPTGPLPGVTVAPLRLHALHRRPVRRVGDGRTLLAAPAAAFLLIAVLTAHLVVIAVAVACAAVVAGLVRDELATEHRSRSLDKR
jgi:hypothetical protein